MGETGAAEPPVQWEARGPGEVAGVGGIRAHGIPKSHPEPAYPVGPPALSLFSHLEAVRSIASPAPSFPRLLPFQLLQPAAASSARSPSVLPAPIGLLPKHTRRGHTAFQPHCACSCLFCCSFRICPRLFPCHGGEPHPWRNGRAPRCRGHCGVPALWCRSWGRAALLGTAGSEGWQAMAGPAG